MPRSVLLYFFFAFLILGSGSILTPLFADDEADLETLQKESQNQRKAMQKIEGQLNGAQDDSEQVMREFQKSMSPEDMEALKEAMASGDQDKVNALSKKLSAKMVAGGGLDKMVNLSLKSFRNQSSSELRADLLARAQGSPYEVIIEKFPKTLDFVVNILQDPLALPQLFKIPQDKKKLMIFIGVNIVLFILAKIVKRVKKGKGSFGRWLFFFSLRLGVLIFFFKVEMTPAFLVFKRTFF